jgi:hypothetical protein
MAPCRSTDSPHPLHFVEGGEFNFRSIDSRACVEHRLLSGQASAVQSRAQPRAPARAPMGGKVCLPLFNLASAVQSRAQPRAPARAPMGGKVCLPLFNLVASTRQPTRRYVAGPVSGSYTQEIAEVVTFKDQGTQSATWPTGAENHTEWARGGCGTGSDGPVARRRRATITDAQQLVSWYPGTGARK